VLLSTNSKTLTQFARNGILLLTIITLVASGIFLFSIYLTREIIRKPLNEMITAFEELQEGNFKVRIRHKPHDEFKILYTGFNNTVENLKNLIDRVLEQDKLINAAELAQLQSQINPHFLYNSFFIISRMAQNEEYEPIVAFVTALAKYYCFINKTQQDAIPLIDEVEHMNNYIDIQQMRFGDRVQVVREECPKLLGDILVPKLILQPIIENAYEYGVEDKLENGVIKVTFQYGNSWFDVNVEDNGDCSDEVINQANAKLSSIDDSEKSHALYNINRRLKLQFGSESGIFIERGSMNGFRVSLHIVHTD
jgi:two-component system, sensor histidine kinase YesM